MHLAIAFKPGQYKALDIQQYVSPADPPEDAAVGPLAQPTLGQPVFGLGEPSWTIERLEGSDMRAICGSNQQQTLDTTGWWGFGRAESTELTCSV